MNPRLLAVAVAALVLIPIAMIAMTKRHQTPVATTSESPNTHALIVMRRVRVQVAKDGSQKESVLGFGEVGLSRNSKGAMSSSNSDIDYAAEPTLNPDQTVNLRLKTIGARSKVAPSRSFIYSDVVVSTASMPANKRLPLAAVADTNHPQVLAALAKRAPLPGIGKPYSVTTLYASTRTEPNKVYVASR